MIGSFNFNNTESSSFSLVCKSVKRPLLPALKVKRIELTGASGAYDFDDDEYALRKVTMKIQYIGTSYEELRTRARQIAAWLSVPAASKLIINDEPDKYYLAKITDEIDMESLWGSGTADVSFDCQPFAYSVDEEVVTFSTVGPTEELFVNPGTRHINYKSPQGSKFTITVNGSFTTLTLAMNGYTLTYGVAASGVLVIDNVEMEVELDGVNKFDVISGDIDSFLNIISGGNILTVSGTDVNATVTINYIPLWI